ncbi:obtusifoliol 14-alpha demethylase-like [Beta vulgaris subsp. vulgaris]|uniref:obtusifoliol 14-alpha demethylase-like n=1 Tax=Beta vulgaris subsp. vulgaris TaxID=3555 RepID=UPI00203713B3|nr:obtusifoliol 14-alpha demethylase-like [Beta vulgaris subsp. vulgaris]
MHINTSRKYTKQKKKMEVINTKLQLFNVALLVIATFIAAIITKWAFKTPIKSSKHLPPPVVKGRLPLIGGLLRFVTNPTKMLTEEYENLGSVFTLNVFNKNFTFLLEPDVIGHFFNAPERELSEREVNGFTVPIFGPGVMYDVDHDIRQEQFRFFKEALRINKLKGFVDIMHQEVQDFFSKWGDNGEVDLKAELEHLVLIIASRCFIGQEVRDSLVDNIDTLLNDINSVWIPITMIFPYLPVPIHRRRDKARKKLGDLLSNIMKSRKSFGRFENDMLQTLLECKYKDGRATTVKEITGLLITAIYGSRRPSVAISTMTGANLLHHNKKYWIAALEEQTSIMKKHGNTIDYDVLSEMQVLYRCVKETLRLHPPISLLLRKSHADFDVITRQGKKFGIPRDHMIFTSAAITNRLPYIYKDPNNYDPERFTLGRDEDKLAGPLSFISFGGGRHSCLNEPFAYLEMKTIWSYLLRNFELELISPFPETEYNDIVSDVKGKVIVRYNRRNLVID